MPSIGDTVLFCQYHNTGLLSATIVGLREDPDHLDLDVPGVGTFLGVRYDKTPQGGPIPGTWQEDPAAVAPEEVEESATVEATTESVTEAEVTDAAAADDVEAADEEPAVEKLKGHLPDDFPGLAALHEAGVNTYSQLDKQIQAGTLRDINGIGKKTEEAITAALAAGPQVPPAEPFPEPAVESTVGEVLP